MIQKTEELQITTENTNLRLRKYERCIFLILPDRYTHATRVINYIKSLRVIPAVSGGDARLMSFVRWQLLLILLMMSVRVRILEMLPLLLLYLGIYHEQRRDVIYDVSVCHAVCCAILADMSCRWVSVGRCVHARTLVSTSLRRELLRRGCCSCWLWLWLAAVIDWCTTATSRFIIIINTPPSRQAAPPPDVIATRSLHSDVHGDPLLHGSHPLFHPDNCPPLYLLHLMKLLIQHKILGGGAERYAGLLKSD